MGGDEQIATASRRADEKLGFYVHLAVYCITNGMLYVINMMASPSIHWYRYVVVGWGIGLALHFFMVYVVDGMHLRERLVQQELKRMQGSGH